MNRRAFFAWLWEMGVFVSLSRYLPWLKPVPQEVVTMSLADVTWDVPAMSSTYYPNAILYDDNDGPIAFWWIVGLDESSPEHLNGYQAEKIQHGGDE
jgi:hypothetical protein